ncbi:MAG: fibronectin type III domain-containing protein [Caldilineaceae bacterium]|nr:fibronectin type III domain-containing protein [Caldilineaceae bacterium]
MSASPFFRTALFGFLTICLLLIGALPALAQDEFPEPYSADYTFIRYTRTPDGVTATVRIRTTKDTFLSSFQPDSNYGGESSLRMGWDQSEYNAMRLMVQFDLDGIPANAAIDGARLYVYQAQTVPPDDQPMVYRAQYVRSAWDEYGVTWNNANYLGGEALPLQESEAVDGWRHVDVTGMIQTWQKDAKPNYGLIVTGDETPSLNRARIFRSRETSLAPYIEVDYSLQCDTVPPQTNVKPLNAYSPGLFLAEWQGEDFAPDNCEPSGIAYYDVFYRINGGSWVHWKEQTEATSQHFKNYAGNGDRVELTARAVDRAGNAEDRHGVQAATTIDDLPPATSMTPLPAFTNETYFSVSWNGTDNLSGVANYDLQWRINQGNWETLLSETTRTSFQITGAQPDSVYDFRVRATDNVGNVQGFPESPQAVTTVRTYSVAQVQPFVPPVIKSDTPNPGAVLVSWTASSALRTTISSFELFYQFNGGAWQSWQAFAGDQFSAEFNYQSLGLGDGVFGFEAIAVDSQGDRQPRTGVAQASVAIDLNDAVQPAQYLPIIIAARQ